MSRLSDPREMEEDDQMEGGSTISPIKAQTAVNGAAASESSSDSEDEESSGGEDEGEEAEEAEDENGKIESEAEEEEEEEDVVEEAEEVADDDDEDVSEGEDEPLDPSASSRLTKERERAAKAAKAQEEKALAIFARGSDATNATEYGRKSKSKDADKDMSDVKGLGDFDMPRTLVMRVAKSELDDQVTIQRDAITALIKGSTVFINYLTAAAHDNCLERGVKTINADDVFLALEQLELPDANESRQMIQSIRAELKVYRDNIADAKAASSRKEPKQKADAEESQNDADAMEVEAASANE